MDWRQVTLEFCELNKRKADKVEDFVNMSYTKQYDYVNEFARVICVELGISVPEIVIKGNSQGCLYDYVRNAVVLNPCQLDIYRASPLMVLAHELRHKWQFSKGLLKPVVYQLNPFVSCITLAWQEQVLDPRMPRVHHELPWEIDAIRYEREIAKRLQVKPFPRPEIEEELKRSA